MSYLLVVDDHDDLRAAVCLLLRVAGHEVAAAEFRAAVAEAIGAEAMQRGTFRGRDRQGIESEFPVAGLASVMLIVEAGRWISFSALGERAADLKRAAKATGTGAIVIEKL